MFALAWLPQLQLGQRHAGGEVAYRSRTRRVHEAAVRLATRTFFVLSFAYSCIEVLYVSVPMVTQLDGRGSHS
jgi:hypothetical protein